MEETVYHFCKETFHMRDIDKTEVVAFTKGLFYKVVHTFERDGKQWFSYIDDRGRKHNLSKEFKKNLMVKVKDKEVLRILAGGSMSVLNGTYFMCKKTMKMRLTGEETAFKKGKVYRLDEKGENYYFLDSDYIKGHQMTEKGMAKYLVKVIDQSVLGEQ